MYVYHVRACLIASLGLAGFDKLGGFQKDKHAEMLQSIPLSRMGTKWDIAMACIFLASELICSLAFTLSISFSMFPSSLFPFSSSLRTMAISMITHTFEMLLKHHTCCQGPPKVQPWVAYVASHRCLYFETARMLLADYVPAAPKFLPYFHTTCTRLQYIGVIVFLALVWGRQNQQLTSTPAT